MRMRYLAELKDGQVSIDNPQHILPLKEGRRVARAARIAFGELSNYKDEPLCVEAGGILPLYKGLNENGYDTIRLPRWALGIKHVIKHEVGHARHRRDLQDGDSKEARERSEKELKKLWKINKEFCEAYAGPASLRAAYPAAYAIYLGLGTLTASQMAYSIKMGYVDNLAYNFYSQISLMVQAGLSLFFLGMGGPGFWKSARSIRINGPRTE